jgi:hypothetical protein
MRRSLAVVFVKTTLSAVRVLQEAATLRGVPWNSNGNTAGGDTRTWTTLKKLQDEARCPRQPD